MKGLRFALTVVVSLVLASVVFADVPAMWKPVKRIAHAGNYPAVATAKVYPDSVFLGYFRNDPSWALWSKRSTNHGLTWPDSTLLMLSGQPNGGERFTEMRHDGRGVHFVASRESLGVARITYCRSTDGGMTWRDFYNVWVGSPDFPGLALDPGGVTVVWTWNNGIFSRRGVWKANSLIWGDTVRVSRVHADSAGENPQIVSGNSMSYCAYRWGCIAPGWTTLRVRSRPVSGGSWSEVALPLPTDMVVGTSVIPSLTMTSSGAVFVAYAAARTSELNTGERIRVSQVGGVSFTTLSKSSSIGQLFNQHNPRIAIDNTDTMYVSWVDDRNDLTNHRMDVYYDRSANGVSWMEWSNQSEQYGNRIVNRDDRQNPPTYNALSPDVVTSPNGKQHFVWQGFLGDGGVLYRARSLDIQAPAPPVNLVGTVIGCPWGMWPFVYLVWNKNTEPDVALYRVDRVNPYSQDTTFLGYTSGVADTEFYDFSISCTTGVREYLVRAQDYNENLSAPSSAWVCPNCPDNGFSLALDLGQSQASSYTERRAGYRSWGSTPDKTVDVDPERLVYRVRGLSPDSSYFLALLEYEDPSSQGRIQSLWAGDVRLREGKALPHKPKLSGFRIPRQAYRDGNLLLTAKRESGPEAALAALVLKDITHPRGGPQSSGKVKFTSQNTLLFLPRPNPAAGQVEFEYHLPGRGLVSLAVYNVLGQRTRTLVNGERLGGSYSEVWDGRDERGLPAKSGVYFVRLQSGGVCSMQKLVLTR